MKQLIGALFLLGVTVSPASSTNDLPQSPAADSNSLLVYQGSMQSLTTASTIPLETGRKLTLEPGVRVMKTDAGYIFSAYTGKRIEFETDRGHVSLPSPASAQLTSEGWILDGRRLDAHALTARRAQDDADTNLKSMQEAAKKLKAKSEPAKNVPPPNQKLHVRWLFGEDPTPTAELFNTAAIQQLTHLSGIGF